MTEDGEIDNTGLVNSEMYQREARHFSSKKLYGEASIKLALGESLLLFQTLWIISEAHTMSPSSTEILANLAQSLLNCGRHQEALR